MMPSVGDLTINLRVFVRGHPTAIWKLRLLSWMARRLGVTLDVEEQLPPGVTGEFFASQLREVVAADGSDP